MIWLRAEYNNGNGVRTPLRDWTNKDGPTSTRETTYTWDHTASNSHFVMLNEYWDGFSDTGTDGDIVTETYNWLEADLAANRDKRIFVFGHEPSFPEMRHLTDSLNKYPTRRDEFWQLLESNGVVAYLCGHTHFYSKHQGDVNGDGSVWQVDVGNAGNESRPSGDSTGATDGMTFLDVVLLDDLVRFDVYRNASGMWDLADSWTVTPHDVVLADVNGDGVVNGLDVDPFVDVLLAGSFQAEADMNEDGYVNGLDVDLFVQSVLGGGVQTVPEPSGLALLGLALAVLTASDPFSRRTDPCP